MATTYAALLVPWERLPAWTEILPPLLGTLAVALLAHAAGGVAAGFVPLYAIPIIWVALHGSRTEALVVVGACCIATTLPMVAIGAPDYPSSAWGQVILNGAVGLLVGMTVNGLVAQLAALTDRLAWLAGTDGLTGVANRRSFDAILAAEIERAGRSGRALSLALLDLDHFKAYNDAFGHQAGDVLLASAAGAWRASLRPFDTLARYGGEEFAAILPDCPPEHGRATADRLRGVLSSGQTASAGVATWQPGEAAASLVARADAAMYEAKNAGRNRTVVA
jgi:diguanylate cyclase (GGDEF)-like protein